MSARALILTYHAVEDGDGPLYVAPDMLVAHLDAIAASGADVVTVSELASALRGRTLTRPAVAITFDDGAASVARVASPLLAERGLRATVFCVAGHLGGRSDWPSARPGPTFELATANELAELAADGWEIGAHGMTHAPLDACDADAALRELSDARRALEDATEAAVTSVAYPYGASPGPAAMPFARREYAAGCTTSAEYAGVSSDPLFLPRVDAHYVRSPRLLDGALQGRLGTYLLARRSAARARRTLRPDFAEANR